MKTTEKKAKIATEKNQPIALNVDQTALEEWLAAGPQTASLEMDVEMIEDQGAQHFPVSPNILMMAIVENQSRLIRRLYGKTGMMLVGCMINAWMDHDIKPGFKRLTEEEETCELLEIALFDFAIHLVESGLVDNARALNGDFQYAMGELEKLGVITVNSREPRHKFYDEIWKVKFHPGRVWELTQ